MLITVDEITNISGEYGLHNIANDRLGLSYLLYLLGKLSLFRRKPNFRQLHEQNFVLIWVQAVSYLFYSYSDNIFLS